MTKIIARPRTEFDIFPRYFHGIFDESAKSVATIAPSGSYIPRVNIAEDATNIYLSAELPGLTKDDVKITVTDGVLTLRGQKKSETKIEGRNFHRIEQRSGTFVREFTLPENANDDAVQASFKNGMLEVIVPKKEVTVPKERHIEINVN